MGNKNKNNPMMNNIERNINNCFISASLQTFLHLEDFIFDVISLKIKDDKKENMKLTYEFKQLINEYKNNDYIINNINPLKIKKILSEENEKYRTNNQQDANEFVTLFLNEMMKEVKGIGIKNLKKINSPIDKKEKMAFEKLELHFFGKNQSFITDLFYGRFKKEIICPNNHIIKVSFEAYNIIQLPIIDKKENENDIQENTIEYFLKKFQDKRVIESEIECIECNKKDIYYTKTTIYNLPFYIILLLNNQSIQYNEHFTIEVKNFIERENNNNGKYELVGVIGYYGNNKNGHYFTKCKINNGQWIYYDSDIKKRIKDYLLIDKRTDTMLFFKKL